MVEWINLDEQEVINKKIEWYNKYYSEEQKEARQREAVREYQQAHKKEIKKYAKAYYRYHDKDIIQKSKEYRESPEGRKRIKEYLHDRYVNDDGYREAILMRGRNYRASRKNGGMVTKSEWLSIRNASPICSMCGKFVGCESLTLDHIVPLSKGGEHTKANIQALCFPCNAKKSDYYSGGF